MNKLASAKSLCENYITKVAKDVDLGESISQTFLGSPQVKGWEKRFPILYNDKQDLNWLQATEKGRAALVGGLGVPLAAGLALSQGLDAGQAAMVAAPVAGAALGGYAAERLADANNLGRWGHRLAHGAGVLTGAGIGIIPALISGN